MPLPAVHVLGVYRIDLTAELLDRAMDWKFNNEFRSDAQRLDAQEHVRKEISEAVLLEVLVTDRDERFSVNDFGQEGSDQVAYGEVFLSEDGSEVVSQLLDVPPGPTLRIAFFLHYADQTMTLKTSYGTVALPAFESMPPRLAILAPYEPTT